MCDCSADERRRSAIFSYLQSAQVWWKPRLNGGKILEGDGFRATISHNNSAAECLSISPNSAAMNFCHFPFSCSLFSTAAAAFSIISVKPFLDLVKKSVTTDSPLSHEPMCSVACKSGQIKCGESLTCVWRLKVCFHYLLDTTDVSFPLTEKLKIAKGHVKMPPLQHFVALFVLLCKNIHFRSNPQQNAPQIHHIIPELIPCVGLQSRI